MGDVSGMDVRVTRQGQWDALVTWSSAEYQVEKDQKVVLEGGLREGASRGPHWMESVQMVGSPRTVTLAPLFHFCHCLVL